MADPHKKFGDSNSLSFRTAPRRRGTFCKFPHSWASRLAGGGLCPFPDSSDPAPDPAGLAYEVCSGWPPEGPMVFVDTGRWRWTTTGFGWFLPLAYSPRLVLFRLHWRVMRVAGGANSAADTRTRDGGASGL